MKQISLTQGKHAIVDDSDFDYLSQWKWCVNGNNYPMRVRIVKKERETITMHRLLMNPPMGMQVDHVNGNRLDNRRANLRVCTRSQNCTNRKSWKISKSGYRGVIALPSGRWRASIKINQKKIHLGVYDTPEMAALAYNVYAKSLYGEFSKLNKLYYD